MKLATVLEALEAISPTRYAESWDNVGLLAGDPDQEVTRALLTIDYTPAVAEEGKREGCELVVAYHPPIFEALKRVVAGTVVFDALRRGVALWSPHTALDVAEGGTNDVLGDLLGMTTREPLRARAPKDTEFKLVTFVPEEALERVSEALFAAGAGRIGQYTRCSFRAPGTGTFFGEEGTNPAVGAQGRLERVSEVKLETVVPIAKVDAVVSALRESHPYEEVAFDLVRLALPPDGVGIGRVGTLTPTPRRELFERIKQGLGVDALLVAGPEEGDVRKVAVCAGAAGDLLDAALARRVDLFLTGEVRHHDALKAARAGTTVVCALHSNSERVTLQRLARRLSERVPGLSLRVSQEDRDPFSLR